MRRKDILDITYKSINKHFGDYREEENLSPYDINQFLLTINESLCGSYYIPPDKFISINITYEKYCRVKKTWCTYSTDSGYCKFTACCKKEIVEQNR